MLIGTTIIGLQKMLKLLRVEKHGNAGAEKLNQNIYEAIINDTSDEQKNKKRESIKDTLLKFKKKQDDTKKQYTSWSATNSLINQANNNIVKSHIEELNFSAKVAKEAELRTAQKNSAVL